MLEFVCLLMCAKFKAIRVHVQSLWIFLEVCEKKKDMKKLSEFLQACMNLRNSNGNFL